MITRTNLVMLRAFPMVLLALLVHQPTLSQQRAAIKLQTFRLLSGLYTIGYEHALSQHISLQFSMEAGKYINMRPNRWNNYVVRGVGAIGSFRYYPFIKKRRAPEGFFSYFASRYVDFNEHYLNSASTIPYEVKGSLLNAGLGVGYKLVHRRLGLEAFVGWGIGRLRSDDEQYRNNIPQFFRSSIEEQKHFPQLDVALCYMLWSSLRKID